MIIELADCECDVCGYRWFGVDGKPLRCAGCRGERWTQTVVRHDLQRLPSVPITRRRDLPACPGVYFVYSADELVYVGVAQQIDSRWNQHERVPRLLHMPDVRIAWLEVADRSGTALAELEMSLIAYLRPPMNGKGPLPLPTAKQRVGLMIRSDAMKAWHAAANATGLTRTQYLEHVLLEPSEFTLAEDVRAILSEHSRSAFNVADKRPTRTEIIEEAVRVWAEGDPEEEYKIVGPHSPHDFVPPDSRVNMNPPRVAEQQVKADRAERKKARAGRKAELKIWNGRGWGMRNTPEYVEHCYVAAHSRADAVRLINELDPRAMMTDREIKEYFAEGCWGNVMDGITPERGVWVTRTGKSDEVPERLFPKAELVEGVKAALPESGRIRVTRADLVDSLESGGIKLKPATQLDAVGPTVESGRGKASVEVQPLDVTRNDARTAIDLAKGRLPKKRILVPSGADGVSIAIARSTQSEREALRPHSFHSGTAPIPGCDACATMVAK